MHCKLQVFLRKMTELEVSEAEENEQSPMEEAPSSARGTKHEAGEWPDTDKVKRGRPKGKAKGKKTLSEDGQSETKSSTTADSSSKKKIQSRAKNGMKWCPACDKKLPSRNSRLAFMIICQRNTNQMRCEWCYFNTPGASAGN